MKIEEIEIMSERKKETREKIKDESKKKEHLKERKGRVK